VERWKRLIKKALEAGADYADLRYIENENQGIRCKNGKIEDLNLGEDRGVGLRVWVNGSWGFASMSLAEENLDKADQLSGEAVALARAANKGQPPRELAPVEPAQTEFTSEIEEDPFDISLDEKIELLQKAHQGMKGEKIFLTTGNINCQKEKKLFISSEGSEIEQTFYRTGAGISAMSTDGKDRQIRSYPSAFGGNYAQKGFEFIREMDLEGEAERVRREAEGLLTAEQCPKGEMTLILGGCQLGLQVHESVGHPIELDRVLGTEAAFAGTSFLTPDNLKELVYGSELVNIYADATMPGALGSFAYDDEGVPGQRVPIVQNGRFENYLTSRETAPVLKQKSNGTMRAIGWSNFPIIRMTNINLEPGNSSLEELIQGTEKGILLDMIKSWSIDDKRINFQFGTEIGWLIEDGKIRGMLRNPTYTGSTLPFWRSCDGIAGSSEWKMWGVPNCGKGEPMQAAPVGHGASYARFRNIKVGVSR